MQKDRLYRFLGGLKSDYDSLKSYILNREHVPTLEQAIQHVLEKECRVSSTETSEDLDTAMAAKFKPRKPPTSFPGTQ